MTDSLHGFLPLRLGDTSGDYQHWKADVLAVRELPEYKLRKLWKLGFGVKDIANNRHWEVFPPAKLKREKPEIDRKEKRGRRLSPKGIDLRYARALRREADAILRFFRLEPEDLERVRGELARFEALVKKV